MMLFQRGQDAMYGGKNLSPLQLGVQSVALAQFFGIDETRLYLKYVKNGYKRDMCASGCLSLHTTIVGCTQLILYLRWRQDTRD